ncbi:MAG: hypothetical protein ACKKMS_00035 [Candidatus Nealsonbacteria bacterium]
MIPIFATGPINKIKVIVGWLDTGSRTAVFEITPKRYFREAGTCGIDSDVFRRKSVNWCREFVFKFWDGRTFRIKKEDFMSHCWEYPPGNNKEYKANRGVFKPKLMILISNLEKLAIKPPTKEEREREMLIEAMK